MPDGKDRLVTILVAPLMSCSARLPVYTLMIAVLMPVASAWQKAGIIWGYLPPAAEPTFFARLGNIVPLAVGFLLLGAAIALSRRARYSEI